MSTRIMYLSLIAFCRSWDFQCDDGECIPDIFQCDGEQDCSSGEDEMNCTGCV